MRIRVAAILVPLALAAPSGAWGSQLVAVDGTLAAGPVLTDGAGGVAWAEVSGLETRVRSADRVLARFVADDWDGGGFYGSAWSIGSLSAAGERVAFTAALSDSAKAKYTGNGWVRAAMVAIEPDGRRVDLATCGADFEAGGVALGDGFTVTRECVVPVDGPPVGPVRIGGVEVGRGSGVAAAGRFAAWREASGQVAVYDTAAGAVASRVAAPGLWTLVSDGTVVAAMATGAGPSTVVAATPLGGAPQQLAVEPGGVRGLAAAPGLVVLVTASGGEERIVLLNGATGDRRELARLWGLPAGTTVATDGTRVAWAGAACPAARITVASATEPAFDDRAGPCPIGVRAAGFDRRAMDIEMRCSEVVPPARCTGTVAVRRGGRVLARRAVDFRGDRGVTLRSTRAGRRLLARRQRPFVASVTTTRRVDGRAVRATTRVRFKR